jgi:hypothetical protein
MTAFKQGNFELFYSSAVQSTALATFTTEDNLMKGMPLCKLPDLGQALTRLGDETSSWKFRALGVAGAASATTPTFTFTLRAIASTAWSAAGVTLGVSNACATVSGVTNGIWQLDIDLWLRTLPIPGTATMTVVAGGPVSGNAFSAGNNAMPVANTSPAVTTLDVTQQYYLYLSAACSASNAANTISTHGVKLYCEN